MHLKRIEITGFKSFATTTELEIAPGITAVVGPNGSGKSNIVDAIRWVLGEQSSRSLRGAKMEDVIFAGSQSRQPVNFSEVSLTLDNADRTLPLEFAEVTLTRRLYRSGESQFAINRQPCRLKDITDLLMDTGLGKEGFSIIGQGQIDEILSHRPEDRRGIFEEAAGIVRYRNRRREAEKHLAETEQNLVRINDILHELEQQLQPLKAQVEVAWQYKEYRQQLEKVEVSLYLSRIQHVHRDWERAKQSLDKVEHEIESCRRRLAAEEAQMTVLRRRIQTLEAEIEQLHHERLHATEEMKRTDGLQEVLRERRHQLVVQRQQAEVSHQKAVQQLVELEQRIAHIRTSLTEKAQTADDAARKLQKAQARLQEIEAALAGQREQSEQLKNAYFEQSNQQVQWHNEERFCRQALDACQQRRARLTHELDALRAEEATLTRALQQLTDEMQTVSELVAEKSRAVDDAREKKEQQQAAAVEACQRQLEQLQQQISQLRSKCEVLREMEQEFAGYSQGAKTILKARNSGRLAGVHGAVAELFHVPRELEVAVEAALGGALQHIVVDDEATGRQCIAFLKDRRAGRATFLPLDVFGKTRSYTEPDLPKALPGLVGLAHHLVRTAETYRPVLRALLGQVLVAEQLEAANRIARQVGYRWRVVTLDGDVVHVGGSMTGGSVPSRKASLLGRQRELAELEAEMTALTDRERQIQQQLQEHRTVRVRVQQALASLLEEETALAQRRQRLELERERLEGERQGNVQRQAVLAEELRQVEAEIQQTHQRLQRVVAHLKQANEQAMATRAQIEALLGAEKQLAQEMTALNEEIGHLRTEVARLEQQRQFFAAQLQECLEAQASQQEETKVWRQRLEEFEQRIVQTLEEERDAEKARQDLRQRIAEVEQALTAKRDEKGELDRSLNDGELRRRQVQQELQQAEEQRQNWSVFVNRKEVELDHLLSSLARDYGISYEWAKAHYPLPDDVAAAEREVVRLKSHIQRLGEVNLGAIEEYERLQQRYQFLSGQQSDLLAAKATLYDAIRELDEKIARRFQTTFETIRHHFQELFAEMFGGGHADLVLTAPDDLLHTGVDIVVQPPGKRMQPLNLLSGGERAMTAIVLLFALLRTRPVPFCVFDEVDANLDDVNVSRFARQLRRFAQESQFLVITHRQGTMEEADVLYGVAMQEAGVSEVFSLSLSAAVDRFGDELPMRTGS